MNRQLVLAPEQRTRDKGSLTEVLCIDFWAGHRQEISEDHWDRLQKDCKRQNWNFEPRVHLTQEQIVNTGLEMDQATAAASGR